MELQIIFCPPLCPSSPCAPPSAHYHLAPPQKSSPHAALAKSGLEFPPHGKVLVNLAEPVLPGKEGLGHAEAQHACKHSLEELSTWRS